MMGSGSPPPSYVYTQQPQVVVQPPILDNPPGDQFVMSLFTTFCCFMPFGIIALIKSIEVRVHNLCFGRSLCCSYIIMCKPLSANN